MDLTSSEIAALKATGVSLDAAFQVGKNGLTEGVVKELQTWLEREPLIKVKILKGARSASEAADAPTGAASTKALATELAERAGVILVEVRGHTALFYKPRRGRRPKKA